MTAADPIKPIRMDLVLEWCDWLQAADRSSAGPGMEPGPRPGAASIDEIEVISEEMDRRARASMSEEEQADFEARFTNEFEHLGWEAVDAVKAAYYGGDPTAIGEGAIDILLLFIGHLAGRAGVGRRTITPRAAI